MTPKLRFQEFEDSWSQVTIAEAASFRRGSFPQPYNIPQWYDDVNGMPFVQVVDVGNDFRLKPKTKQMISELAMPKSVFVPKGSIVITIQGSIGRIALTQYDSYVDRTLLIITEKKLPLDDYFFIIALKKIFDYEKTIAVGGTIKTITKEKLAKFKFSLPHRSEQQRIGDFIRLVDQKINLLTKKKEALETYKKGLMQKIFSQELRFKREDGTDYPEWEEVFYSEFLKERDNKHPQSDEFPLCSFVAHKGVVPKGDRYNREFLVSDKKGKKYKRTKRGDFIYSSNNLETGSIGLNEYGNGCISPVYSVFSIDKGCDINFIAHYLVTKANLHKMIRFRQGVMYGQWRIHETDFLKIKVAITSNEEQKHIGEVIKSMNSGLEELERLISATSKLKKGLLQQMFV